MKNKKINLLLFLFFMCNLLFVSCGTPASTQSTQTQTNIPKLPKELEKQETNNIEILGVVKSIHYKNKTITIYDLNNELDMVFTYTGGTDIRDTHNKMITMDQIEVGEIVDGTYNNSNRKLLRVYIHKEAWTYNGVHTFSINQSDNRITIAKRNYRYDEQIVITDGKNLIEPIDLNARDELSIKGIGTSIYSIRVTKGHGYIRLKGEDAFLGGTIEVGYGIIVPVVENMLIVAREGSYRVILENGELEAVKNVRLLRDEEITLDLSEYKVEEERIGHVDFQIRPIGADLYINGKLVNYAELVKLNYGEHVIRVALTGYEDFTGILNIAETTSTVQITLAKVKEEEISDNERDEEEESEENNQDEEENDDEIENSSDDKSNNSSSSSKEEISSSNNSNKDKEDDKNSDANSESNADKETENEEEDTNSENNSDEEAENEEEDANSESNSDEEAENKGEDTSEGNSESSSDKNETENKDKDTSEGNSESSSDKNEAENKDKDTSEGNSESSPDKNEAENKDKDTSENNSESSSEKDNSSNNTNSSSSGSVSSGDGESNTTLEKTEEDKTSMGSVEIEKEHTITIQTPKDAKVYFNGILKGIAPITIPKEIGTHTITLSRSGYTTKSYTVEVKNNGEDVMFNFPEMTKVSQ